MMFFVTEKRLQAILDADRSQQRMAWEREQAQGLIDAFHRHGEIIRQEADRSLILSALSAQQTSPTQDARLVAKKAATKAARPARKPREKK